MRDEINILDDECVLNDQKGLSMSNRLLDSASINDLFVGVHKIVQTSCASSQYIREESGPFGSKRRYSCTLHILVLCQINMLC